MISPKSNLGWSRARK